MDRFGRSLKHLVNSLAELENVGVAFVSLRDSLDRGRQRKHMVDEFRELLVRCGEDVCGFVL